MRTEILCLVDPLFEAFLLSFDLSMSTYIFANLKQHLIKVTPCIKDLVHTQPTDFGDIGGLPDKVLQFRQNILLRELLKNIAMEDASEP